MRVLGTLPGALGGPRFDFVSPDDTYRIAWLEPYSLSTGLLPLEDRVSNGFVLRQP